MTWRYRSKGMRSWARRVLSRTPLLPGTSTSNIYKEEKDSNVCATRGTGTEEDEGGAFDLFDMVHGQSWCSALWKIAPTFKISLSLSLSLSFSLSISLSLSLSPSMHVQEATHNHKPLPALCTRLPRGWCHQVGLSLTRNSCSHQKESKYTAIPRQSDAHIHTRHVETQCVETYGLVSIFLYINDFYCF